MLGYAPSETVVHVNASEETTYTVTYQPALVDYTVKHYQQNVSNDGYTLADTEAKTGYTKTAVGASLAKTYTGFYSLLYDTAIEIAADGSTEVEIYYDRYYYLVNFNLDGGYGVEPIYARYGTTIGDVGTPTKAGYSFAGWSLDGTNTVDLPSTMPVENKTYQALWTPGESGFTVVFWYENANDDGYSVAGTYTPANVAPGTTKSSGDYKDQSFTGRDDEHFTYNVAKAETVTVAGDGSTVLNVYYTRNEYTITFMHLHTASCYEGADVSGEEANTVFPLYDPGYQVGQIITIDGNNGCYLVTNEEVRFMPGVGFLYIGYYVPYTGSLGEGSIATMNCNPILRTVTAKYDSDITSVWETDPIKSLLDQGYVFTSSVTGYEYSFLEKMPGQDITMTQTEWSGYTYKWYYYLEVPEGMSAPEGAMTRRDGGKTYYLYHTTTVKAADGFDLTYDEDYYPITGYTQRDTTVPEFDSNREAYLYYTRNQYDLTFINYGTTVKTDTKYYQADISGEGFTPDYPDTLEADAYVFDGWYTDQFFSENGKFNFTGATMPAGPMILYAHWVPKNHTVKTYLTKDVLDNGGDPLNTWAEVPHGTAVTNPPKDPTNGQYTFVGWFYTSDTGEEKAFDFSMPVNRDLNLYAKWSSNTLTTYTVKYQLEDGTEIAATITGNALAGTTKTFNAKTSTQLYAGYQSGYFPKVSSHSITIDIEGTAENKKNEYIFVYVEKPEVPYTVRYLEKGTGNELADSKTVTTRDAVVTETFLQITGYAPDAYQKQLVLAAENNEIIFWYVKDDVHAPVRIIHWVQNIEGDDYTERQSSTNLNGVIGTKYSETPLTIAGFQYNGEKSNAEGTLTAAGLVLNLYYDRIEYPYEFRFLEQGTDKVLADSVTGTARYQAQVTQTAKSIPGYTLVSAENQAINIAIEDGTTAVRNVKTFYYTEQTVDIRYEVVGPANCGTLDNYQEAQLKVITGVAQGSMPTAAEGFKFVGWYKDQECTQPVDASWVVANKLTPGKAEGAVWVDATTYYAKFEYNLADLTITKQGCENIDEGQSFLFDVTGPNGYSNRVVINGNGSVTLKGLKIGEYTVKEVTSWSWRYTPTSNNPQSITLQPAQTNVVSFTNTRKNPKWLGGDVYCKNIFGNSD